MPTPPSTERLPTLDAAWNVTGHGPKLRAVRKAAGALRERIASGPRVLGVRTLPITTFPYPTKYAFWAAAISPAPFVVMKHQCLLVQFLHQGEVKSLLFNPTDPVASKETPFFARLASSVPSAVQNLLSKPFDPLEAQLERLGVSVDSIDYIAFDHMHTQDLRPLMGTTDGKHAPRFPNAKLLVPRAEWDDWDDLHPMQRAWFIADGKQRVRPEHIVLTDGDLMLGDGAMLLRTPGHTTGNQTLFFNTPDGVWGVSENGTCADNWSPHESRIPGLARVARHQDLDVVLNANTPELGATQYTSMILERTVVDPVRRAPGFFQMFSSSEVLPSAIAPGLTPTLRHEKLEYGTITRTRRAAAKPEPRRGVEGSP